MNKIVSLVKMLAASFVLLSSFATFGQQYSVGFRAGGMLTWPGFANGDVKDTFGRRLKPGFNAGLFVGFPMKNQYEVLVEGGASQRGRVITFNDGLWRNNLTMQMTDMSLLLRKSFKFMFKKDVPAEAFINIGPEINYWFKSKGFLQINEAQKYGYEVFHGDEPPNDGQRYMTLKNTNDWLFSLSVGAGFKAPLRNNKFITTELRFISGHTWMGQKDSAYIDGLIWGAGGMQDTFQTNLKTISLSVSYIINHDAVESKKGKSNIKGRMKGKRGQ